MRDYRKGSEKLSNEARRKALWQRRQTYRRAPKGRSLRILRGRTSPSDAVQLASRWHKSLLKLDKEFARPFPGAGSPEDDHTLPYRLRALALGEPLTPPWRRRRLFHLAQRQGFKSNRKATRTRGQTQGRGRTSD